MTARATHKGPWEPLEKTAAPYLKKFYKAERLGDIRVTQGSKSPASMSRMLRIRWQTEVSARLCDLELVQRQSDEEVKKVIFSAVETDALYAQALCELEASGYDTRCAHLVYAGITEAHSTFPIPLGVSLKIADGQRAGSAGSGGADAPASNTYWSTLSNGCICYVDKDGIMNLEKAKQQPLLYPRAVGTLPPAANNSNPRIGLTVNPPEACGDAQATTITRVGEDLWRYCTVMGTMRPKQLSNGCIILPAAPTASPVATPSTTTAVTPSAAPVGPDQQFILAPVNHVVSMAALHIAEHRVRRLVLGQGGLALAGDKGGKPTRDEGPHKNEQRLLAIPKDVATEAMLAIKANMMESVRAREADLTSLALELMPTTAPNFMSCEVTEQQWRQEARIALELEFFVFVYDKAIYTDPTVVPLMSQ